MAADTLLKIVLDNVRVSSIVSGCDGSEDRLMENVSFASDRFEQTYTMQNVDGSEATQPRFAFITPKNAEVR